MNITGNYTIRAINNLIDIMQVPNDMTGGVFFWQAIILIIWFMLFGILQKNNNEKALLVSFFICLILSILLRIVGLVDNMPMNICFAGVAISIFLR